MDAMGWRSTTIERRLLCSAEEAEKAEVEVKAAAKKGWGDAAAWGAKRPPVRLVSVSARPAAIVKPMSAACLVHKNCAPSAAQR